MAYDSHSYYLFTTGDKHIHVFHNVVGLKATIADLMTKKMDATNKAQIEWLQQQIDEAQYVSHFMQF